MVKTSMASPAGRPADDVPGKERVCRPRVLLDHRVANSTSRDEQQEARTHRHGQDRREHSRAPVLRQRLPVSTDAVDAVAASLDLRHRGDHGEEREREAEAERDLAGLLGPLHDGGRKGVVRATPGRDGLDRGCHDPGGAILVDVGSDAGERDQEGYDRQTGLQRKGAAVGEPVAVPEPHERVDRDPEQSVAAGEVPGVLGVELVAIELGRDRDGAGSGHARQAMRRGWDSGRADRTDCAHALPHDR
jgi:hypothetical protein